MASGSDWLVFATNFSPVAVSDREKARRVPKRQYLKRRTRACRDRPAPDCGARVSSSLLPVRTRAGWPHTRTPRARPPEGGGRAAACSFSRAAGLCRPMSAVPRRGTPRATGASQVMGFGVAFLFAAALSGASRRARVVGPGRLARGDRREDRGDDAERGDPNPSIRVRRGASDPEGDQERRRAGAAIAVVAASAPPNQARARPPFPPRRGGVILGTRG